MMGLGKMASGAALRAGRPRSRVQRGNGGEKAREFTPPHSLPIKRGGFHEIHLGLAPYVQPRFHYALGVYAHH